MALAIYIIDDILYYSTNINEVFILQQHSDWTTALRNVFYLLHTICVLIFSADIVRQMEVMYEFLNILVALDPKSCKMLSMIRKPEENLISTERYLVYVNHLGKNSISLKVANIFPITYSLVANVSVSVLVGIKHKINLKPN